MSMAPNGTAVPRTARAMGLLARGVPLSLLFDLVLGPRSRELLDAERVTAPVPLQVFNEVPVMALSQTG